MSETNDKPQFECVPIYSPDLRTPPFITECRYMTYEEIESMYGSEMVDKVKRAVQNTPQSQ